MDRQERFKQIISGAQALMLNESFNEKVEQKAAQSNGRTYVPKATKNVLNEEQYQTSPQYSTASSSAYINEAQLSKLPPAIRESFKETPPIQIDNTENGIIGNLVEGMTVTSGPINEMKIATGSQSYTPTAGIDYNYIKYLIDESISKHINTVKENLLNESTLKGVRITNGNKIQVLDSKGNLYEGILKLKKKKE